METITLAQPMIRKTIPAGICLNDLMEELLTEYRDMADLNNTIITNSIPADSWIYADKLVLSAVLNSMLSTLSEHTYNSRLGISAKIYQKIVLIHFKDNSILNNDSVTEKLNKLQPMAEKLCGGITINRTSSGFASVTLSVLNRELKSSLFM